MTVEELLKPRYKVIADYPNSSFTINEIVYADNFGKFTQYEDYGTWQLRPEFYPAVFKKLEWWEDREEKDMPEYVTNSHVKEGYHFIEKTGVFKVVSKGSFLDENMHVMYNIRYASPHYCIIEGHRDTYNYSNFFPATEEEYLNQNKTTLQGQG